MTTDRVARLERALFGVPDEGNPGILARVAALEAEGVRVHNLEKPIKRIGWILPFATAIGTAVGVAIASVFGGGS